MEELESIIPVRPPMENKRINPKDHHNAGLIFMPRKGSQSFEP